MRTRRVWTRRIVVAACCLGIGALVTFIVAVQRAIWPPGRFHYFGVADYADGELQPFVDGGIVQTADMSAYAWVRRELSGTGKLDGYLKQGHGYEFAGFIVVPELRGPQYRCFMTVRSGWPWLALEDTGVGAVGPPLGAILKCGWQAPPWLAGSEDPAYVPLRPIPLGFAADSLLYSSAPWAALLALSWWRHRSRTLKGHCALCNYDRAGLPPGSPCPECGAAA